MNVVFGPALSEATARRRWSTATGSSPTCWRRSAARSKTITFETYIYWSGEIGDRVRRCAGRARAGRRQGARAVRLGRQRQDGRRLWSNAMKAAGVEVEQYNPLRWYTLAAHQQPHPPQAPGGGRHASASPAASASATSGRGDAQDPKHWRDTHFRVEGPVVAQMQAAFIDNWIEVTGARAARRGILPGARAAPARSRRRSSSARPAAARESMQLMYLHVDRGGGEVDPALGRVLRARRARGRARWSRRRSGACSVQHHRARAAHRLATGAPRLALDLGRAAARRRSRSTSTSRRCSTAR